MSWRDLVKEDETPTAGWKSLVKTEEGGYVDPTMPSTDLGDIPGSPGDQVEAWPAASEPETDRSAWDVFTGAFDAIGSVLSGATTGAVASGAGTIAGMFNSAIDGTWGTPEGVQTVKDTRDEWGDALTYEPRTEAGQEYLQDLGEIAEPLTRADQLGPLAGAIPTQPIAAVPGALSRAGMRQGAEGIVEDVQNTPRAIARLPGELAGAPGELARNIGDDLTDWRTAQQAGRAQRSQEAQTRDAQGVLTNRWLGPEMTEVISDASPEMKKRYADMKERSMTQRYGSIDPITGERIRTKDSGSASPRDVIAEEFEMRAEELAQVGQRYHGQIKEARRAMEAEDANGFRVDTTPLQVEVNDSLKKFGIAVDPKTGELDGSMATIPNKEFELINEAYQRFHRGLNNHGAGQANFGDLEDLKKYLQRTAYQNSRDAGRGGDANEFIKQMSGIVNGQLRRSTDDLDIGYGDANDGLSSIITVFNDMNRVIHPDSDINFFDVDFDGKAMSDLARQSRGLTNNTRAGINLDETLSLMDDTLSREGGNLTPEARARLNMVDDGQGNYTIETDLRQLAVFAEQLNQLLGDGKVTSFHDLIKSATNGQGGHLANAGYNAIWGNYVGTTADLAKEITGRVRSNRPDKVAERHDKLVEQRRKFEDYNRDTVLESLDVVLGQ